MRLGTDVVSSIQDIVKYMMDIVKSLNRKRIAEFGEVDNNRGGQKRVEYPRLFWGPGGIWTGYWAPDPRPWAGTQRMVRRNLRVHRRTVFREWMQELGLPRAVMSPIRD